MSVGGFRVFPSLFPFSVRLTPSSVDYLPENKLTKFANVVQFEHIAYVLSVGMGGLPFPCLCHCCGAPVLTFGL